MRLHIGQHRRINGGAEECQTIDQYAPDRIPENDEYTQRRGKQHSDQVVDKVHRTIARHQCLLGQQFDEQYLSTRTGNPNADAKYQVGKDQVPPRRTGDDQRHCGQLRNTPRGVGVNQYLLRRLSIRQQTSDQGSDHAPYPDCRHNKTEYFSSVAGPDKRYWQCG
ncbi:hypothetical protein D3C73_1035420 [compost metagenome]